GTLRGRAHGDYQSGHQQNLIPDPVTGAFLGRPFPDFDAVRNTYNPNYTWQQNRSINFLYTKNFAGGWGINSAYWYLVSSRYRTRWNPTTDTSQFLGFGPEEDKRTWRGPR